ncbi:MAG TPA: Mut7-C RNAse domain-containing protein [candidate division Zixibacteria bacterium]|nr:Mut7-C RNAse domain-containing protein [candidate division Zixibacteria bacterium]
MRKITKKVSSDPKFIVDRMYNRLARWLRILGYDTLFDSSFSDKDYLEKAKNESRILITRNENLASRASKLALKAVQVDAPTIEERLIKLYKEANIALSLNDDVISRCSKCNSEIEPIQKKDIENLLLEGTKNQYNEFWICKNINCQQIYWKGPHWDKMKKSLEKCKEILTEQ